MLSEQTKAFKEVKGFNKREIDEVLIVSEQIRTRSSYSSLDGFKSKKETDRYRFSVLNMVVDVWNWLNSHIVLQERVSPTEEMAGKAYE